MTERKKRLAILEEIEKDPVALTLLYDKASWYSKSLHVILRDFGDPRNWESYKKRREVK